MSAKEKSRGTFVWLAFVLVALLAALNVGAESASTNARLVTYETRHYRINTDVDPELARDIAIRMDAMFDEYARRLNAFSTAGVGRLDVYVFTSKSDYGKFIQDRLPNTGGVFIPDRNVLCAYLEDQGRDTLKRTLQHEAFHQFAHYAIDPKLPVWVNEGIAQVFEEGVWSGQQFFVQQTPPRRLRQLKTDLEKKKLVPFDKFVAMNHEQWAAGMRDRDRGAAQYNQAWAMVSFLVYAQAPDGSPVYRKRFFNMLSLIHGGMDGTEAFKNSFGANFAGFQQRFKEYVDQLTPSTEARYIEQVEVLADLMIEIQKQEKVTFGNMDRFRDHLTRGGYRLTYTRGNLKWQSEADVATYFRDTDGRLFTSTQLEFIRNPRAPLNDVVLRPPGGIEYRARFYFGVDGQIEREILTRQF